MQRLSHDSLYNLHEIVIDMPDSVNSIHMHPDLVCVCGSKQLLDKFDSVLLLQSGTYDCGLFAVAFAECLSYGLNANQYFFEQGAMRRHL